MEYRRLLFSALILGATVAAAAVLESPDARFVIDDATGAVTEISGGGRRAVRRTENSYLFLSKSGDVTAYEKLDRTVKRSGTGGGLTFECVNPALPDIRIFKRYRIVNRGLRRELEFRNSGAIKRYVIPATAVRFAPGYLAGLWHFGAGYLGPYRPFPRVDAPTPVNQYRQSSKGMVFTHPGSAQKAGGFAFYRVKINDAVVLPWWHSTIGHYREYADRLYWLEDGFRMALGCFDLAPGGGCRVTDCFNVFDGELFEFFGNVYGRDAEVMKTVRAIPPPPAWLDNVFANVPQSFDDYFRWLTEMNDDGIVVSNTTVVGTWADYRGRDGRFQGHLGGAPDVAEVRQWFDTLRKLSPRIRPIMYGIVVAASHDSAIVREHPEYFRKFDRAGREDSLFPGLKTNYQTMFNHSECRKYLISMLIAHARAIHAGGINIDEFQMTNTIDWQRESVTRDDHTAAFWRELKAALAGTDLLLTANGSGVPYGDLNCIESRTELAPARWRDWAGIGLGLALVDTLRPGSRIYPAYWIKGVDYVNRLLAFGWIPYPYVHANFAAMRAAYETGRMLPVNARYTPDWKRDAAVNVESYAMRRRDASDVLLSFINRAARPAAIPVAIDLATLGFAPETRINLWRIEIENCVDRKSSPWTLADRELKQNWRQYRWRDGHAVTVNKLVYSGPASGIFKTVTPPLAADKMTQFLATAAPAALFAADGLPGNYFYTAHRRVKIDGRTVSGSVPSTVLLADKDAEFYDVTVGGSPAATARFDLDGACGTLIEVPAGVVKLDWKTRPRTISAAADNSAFKPVCKNGRVEISGAAPDSLWTLSRNGRTVYTGRAPIMIPARRANGRYTLRRVGCTAPETVLKLSGGAGSAVKPPQADYEAERKTIRDVNVRRSGVTVRRTATLIGRYENAYALQSKLSPGVAAVDSDKLTLEAGSSRREHGNLGFNVWAGMELSGARQMRVRLTNTFFSTAAVSVGRGHTKLRNADGEQNFAGLMVDYRTARGGYVRRVALNVGLFHSRKLLANPPWGRAKKPDLNFDLGDLLGEGSEKTFSLDLAKYAPRDWDGTLFVTLGAAQMLPNRRLQLEILGFNDAAAGDFLTPEMPLKAGERKMPPPLKWTKLSRPPVSLRKIDAEEWRNWSKIVRFQPLKSNSDAILRAQTTVYCAFDFEKLYIGFDVADTRPPQVKSENVGRNEHVEFMLLRPDGKLFQALADAEGNYSVYIDGAQTEIDGITVNGEIRGRKGYRVFVAVPLDMMKFDMQKNITTVKGNFCRTRYGTTKENSAWTPLDKLFAEIRNFGTFTFNFD